VDKFYDGSAKIAAINETYPRKADPQRINRRVRFGYMLSHLECVQRMCVLPGRESNDPVVFVAPQTPSLPRGKSQESRMVSRTEYVCMCPSDEPGRLGQEQRREPPRKYFTGASRMSIYVP
jgi:hypothetical protein